MRKTKAQREAECWSACRTGGPGERDAYNYLEQLCVKTGCQSPVSI
jgi:hypothetical protein